MSRVIKQIEFSTFQEGWNQGQHIPLGRHAVETEIIETRITNRNGCCSPELRDAVLEVAVIMGRSFVITDGKVTLPYTFKPFPLPCPCCGK